VFRGVMLGPEGPAPELIKSLGMCRHLWQPIQSADGRLLGAIIACSPEALSADARSRALLERGANLAKIAIERAHAETALTHMSNFDRSTALPNRSLLLDRLGRALVRARQQGGKTALLLINLDGTRRINESLGYAFGDEFIKAIAARLRSNLKCDETLARVGGDEFAVVLEGVHDEADTVRAAKTLLERITCPLRVMAEEVVVTASLGASMAPRDADEADALFRQADVALHRAKLRGRNSLQLFRAGMNPEAGESLKLLKELRRALEQDEFTVHYQPKLDLRSGTAAGAEALMRWQHPVRGLVPPSEFIPMLEETGLILQADDWLIRRVCADLAELQHLGLKPPRVAVNLSARQFHQADFAERIAALLDEAGVPGELLEVEITESLIMHEPEKTAKALQELRAIGVGVAVDDFGTGYSSLSYLKTFPIDVLKIDKSFVDGVAKPGPDAALVHAILSMAHSLGMRVVAEGVESAAQRAFLEAQGCDQLQGYLYSRPLPFGDFREFIAACPTLAVLAPAAHVSPVPLR